MRGDEYHWMTRFELYNLFGATPQVESEAKKEVDKLIRGLRKRKHPQAKKNPLLVQYRYLKKSFEGSLDKAQHTRGVALEGAVDHADAQSVVAAAGKVDQGLPTLRGWAGEKAAAADADTGGEGGSGQGSDRKGNKRGSPKEGGDGDDEEGGGGNDEEEEDEEELDEAAKRAKELKV